MRFYLFVALLAIALGLDMLLLALGLAQPQARLFQAPVARAAPHAVLAPSSTATRAPSPTATHTPSPTASPTATATVTAAPSPTPSPSPTATPPPPRLLAAKAVSFTPANRAVRANIRLALALDGGALSHVLLAPGDVFSFNALLGPRPQRLPWKYVVVQPTPAPTDGAAPASSADVQRIQGGGLCDLASRFVMAARPLLPAKAFRFVNHVRSNGVHLNGVPTRDTVSIWAVGGGPGEQDLTIRNLSDGWLEFAITRDGERITVTARLWDRAPAGSFQ